MRHTTATTHTTDDEMTHCIAGSDLVAGFGPSGVTLYHHSPRSVRLLGTFADVRDAWAAIDRVDLAAMAPAPVLHLRDTRRGTPAAAGFDSLAA